MAGQPVRERVHERIHREGPITFAAYMEMALYDAAGVNRNEVAQGAELLGLDLDRHIANVIEALRPIAPQLGLRG